MRVKPHVLHVNDDAGKPTEQLLAYVGPASGEAVRELLNADPNDPDGRSNWVWVRLQNGDLILGTFPQGATYEAVERDASAAEQAACAAGA